LRVSSEPQLGYDVLPDGDVCQQLIEPRRCGAEDSGVRVLSIPQKLIETFCRGLESLQFFCRDLFLTGVFVRLRELRDSGSDIEVWIQVVVIHALSAHHMGLEPARQSRKCRVRLTLTNRQADKELRRPLHRSGVDVVEFQVGSSGEPVHLTFTLVSRLMARRPGQSRKMLRCEGRAFPALRRIIARIAI
jgi:hypothetical protein